MCVSQLGACFTGYQYGVVFVPLRVIRCCWLTSAAKVPVPSSGAEESSSETQQAETGQLPMTLVRIPAQSTTQTGANTETNGDVA